MRQIATLIALIFITTHGSLAQRPWIRASDLPPGAPDRLRVVANALHAFGTITLRSFDQGASWDTVASLPANVIGMAAFQTAGVSIAMAQPVKPGPVIGHFTQSGTGWTGFDTIDVGSDLAVDVETIGDTYVVGLNTNRLIVRGDDVRIVTIAEASGAAVLDVATTSNAIVVATTKGVYVSKDLGNSWEKVDPPLAEPNMVTAYPLRTVNGMIYGATTHGVFSFDATSSTWTSVGTWADSIGTPVVIDIAGDENRLLAMTVHDDTTQMFRLENGQGEWIITAYALPGLEPTPSANSLVIDAGWAVTAHRSSQEPDASGVYHYNLNDFTSVRDHPDNLLVHIYATTEHLFVEHPWESALVELFDLAGRRVATLRMVGGRSSVPFPHVGGGLFVVRASPIGLHTSVSRIIAH